MKDFLIILLIVTFSNLELLELFQVKTESKDAILNIISNFPNLVHLNVLWLNLKLQNSHEKPFIFKKLQSFKFDPSFINWVGMR